MSNLQTTTEYQSVGSTYYNGLHIPGPENYTQFSSAIRLTTNDLFSKPPVIHTDGVIECAQILPNVNNQLVVAGNLYVTGFLYTKNPNTGNLSVNGGIWEF